MTPSRPSLPFSHVVKISDLSIADETPFSLQPDAADRKNIAQDLGLDGLRKVRFEGRLFPDGVRDWRLVAQLGATVTQPCIVTLAPVTTRIEEPVERVYRADLVDLPTEAEVEMPEETSEEPLRDAIDLGQVLVEALALALPLYPRSDGADLDQAGFAPPGVTPMSDDEAKPFAGLAGLRDRLSKADGEDGDS